MSESQKILPLFKIVSYSEGVSFLLLLFVAMPLKYIWSEPMAVKVFGWAHGILFMIYLVVAVYNAHVRLWSYGLLAGSVLAALLPFGPFVFDRRMRE